MISGGEFGGGSCHSGGGHRGKQMLWTIPKSKVEELGRD